MEEIKEEKKISLRGRPAKYSNEEELLEKAEEYFNNPDNFPYTITGVALHLGFESKQSLYDYGKKDKFSYSIKKISALVENSYEKLLANGGGSGIIFALKNFHWTDKQEIEHSGETTQNVNITKEELQQTLKEFDDEH